MIWARTTYRMPRGLWHVVTQAAWNPATLSPHCGGGASLNRSRAITQAKRPTSDLCPRCLHMMGECPPDCPRCACERERRAAARKGGA